MSYLLVMQRSHRFDRNLKKKWLCLFFEAIDSTILEEIVLHLKSSTCSLDSLSTSFSKVSEHITPVLRSLHWLPVTFRIDFKVLLLVHKSLNGLGPECMPHMLTEYKSNRPLRSVVLSQLEILRVHTKQGESAFRYFASRSWNQPPEEIRCAKTLATFKSRLKTHLFSCAFVEWALCYVWTDCTVFYV